MYDDIININVLFFRSVDRENDKIKTKTVIQFFVVLQNFVNWNFSFGELFSSPKRDQDILGNESIHFVRAAAAFSRIRLTRPTFANTYFLWFRDPVQGRVHGKTSSYKSNLLRLTYKKIKKKTSRRQVQHFVCYNDDEIYCNVRSICNIHKRRL